MRISNLNREYSEYAEATFICDDNEFGELMNNVCKNFSLIGDKIVCKSERNRQHKNEYKVIFNAPATILFVGDKKYISKAHNEEFDPEKGLLMCLAKANGISHLDLKRMIKGATYQKLARGGVLSEEPKKKRGRPRKEKSLEVKPKRPVGRPRKNKG